MTDDGGRTDGMEIADATDADTQANVADTQANVADTQAANVAGASALDAGPEAAQLRTERVRGTMTVRPPAARTRWVIATLVTVLVLAVSAGGFMILSIGAATSALVGYVPTGSVGYLEIRLDAPGDQRQNAANLLSHFPGFADQSTLGRKLDEALDQLVGSATSGRQSFTGNIKGWLGDSIALVHTRIPPVTAGSPASDAREAAGLLLIGVSNPTSARTWADGTLGPAARSETYGGVSLAQIQKHGAILEYGVISNVLLAGDPQSVHDAIDSKGASTFADSASFKAAAASVTGDRLAFGYLDLHAVAQAVDSSRSRFGLAATISLDQLPAWAAVSVRTESNSLNATVALPDTNLAPVAANHTSMLATRLPASTIAAGEVHDLASLLTVLTTTLGAPQPGAGPSGPSGAAPPSTSPGPFDQALQGLGGLDSLIGWMGDATVAVIEHPATANSLKPDVSVGVVVAAKDAAAADLKVTQLKNLVSLAGSSFGVKLSDETYNGTTITVVDVGDLNRFSAPVAQPGPAAGPVDLKVAVAQKDDLVIVGVGDVFVKAVLDTTTGQTLADQDAYKMALDKAGSSNTGQLFVNIPSALDLVASRLSAEQQRRYQADIKPYLEPFRAFSAAVSAGDPNRARFVITVK